MRTSLLALLLTACLLLPAAGDTQPKPDIAIDPTNRGAVQGQVYDARTGAPIEGATVAVQQDGRFDDKGEAVATTDAMGRYKCRALIGRTSSNFDVGRAVLSGPIGLLLGSATNRTKRVDVSRLPLRATREGYEPFEGIVDCRRVEAARFSVTMEPILLVPTGSGEVSTTAEGWGVARIVEVSVDPAVAHPGDKVVVTAKVQTPPLVKPRDLKVECAYSLGDGAVHKGLKLQKDPVDGMLLFTTDFKVGGKAKPAAAELEASITSCPYDVVTGGDKKVTVLQIVAPGTDQKVPELRTEAFRLEQAGDSAQASTRWKELCAMPDAGEWDYRQLWRVSRRLNDTATAASAAERLVAVTPPKPEPAHMLAEAVHAVALVADSQGQKVIDEYGPGIQAVKERDRPGRVPLQLMAALGSAYVQVGRLDDADKLSLELLKWQGAELYSGTIEFRNSLRLAHVRAKAAAEPGNGLARADYGRALMDLGRWEEAIDELQAASQVDPNLPAARRDIGYALLHVRGKQADTRSQDEALEAAEKQVIVPDKKGKTAKTKDFFAWHSLAMLRYARARRLEDAKDPGAAEAVAKCKDALREALMCGRTGAEVDEGVYLGSLGYANGRLVAIAGFAYPEASNDFTVLQSMRALDRDANDYLAWYSLGSALLDLGQADLAEGPIQRSLALKPGFAEARYAVAMIDLKKGERDAAAATLREVLKLNPRHPHANLTLAKLLTEDGDMSGAAACLASHARYYGEVPR